MVSPIPHMKPYPATHSPREEAPHPSHQQARPRPTHQGNPNQWRIQQPVGQDAIPKPYTDLSVGWSHSDEHHPIVLHPIPQKTIAAAPGPALQMDLRQAQRNQNWLYSARLTHRLRAHSPSSGTTGKTTGMRTEKSIKHQQTWHPLRLLRCAPIGYSVLTERYGKCSSQFHTLWHHQSGRHGSERLCRESHFPRTATPHLFRR